MRAAVCANRTGGGLQISGGGMASQGREVDEVLYKLGNHGHRRCFLMFSSLGCLACSNSVSVSGGPFHFFYFLLSGVVAHSTGSSALANVRFESCSADRATASLGTKP